MKQIQSYSGFTLIELLIVILIVSVLAAIAWPQYQKAVLKSKVAEVQVWRNIMRKQLMLWQTENGTLYPAKALSQGELGMEYPPSWSMDEDGYAVSPNSGLGYKLSCDSTVCSISVRLDFLRVSYSKHRTIYKEYGGYSNQCQFWTTTRALRYCNALGFPCKKTDGNWCNVKGRMP